MFTRFTVQNQHLLEDPFTSDATEPIANMQPQLYTTHGAAIPSSKLADQHQDQHDVALRRMHAPHYHQPPMHEYNYELDAYTNMHAVHDYAVQPPNDHNQLRPVFAQQYVRQPKDFEHPLTCFFWYNNGFCTKSNEECAYAHFDTGIVADAPIHTTNRGVLAGGNASRAVTQESLGLRERELAAREIQMHEWAAAAQAEMAAKDAIIADLGHRLRYRDELLTNDNAERDIGDENKDEAIIKHAETLSTFRGVVEGAVRVVEHNRAQVDNLVSKSEAVAGTKEMQIVGSTSAAMGEVLDVLAAVQDAVSEMSEDLSNNGQSYAAR